MSTQTLSDLADLLCCPQPLTMVKTCLDNYDICEPEVQHLLNLELDYLELQNKLLCRQIELLEKSQAYHYVLGNDSEVLPAV